MDNNSNTYNPTTTVHTSQAWGGVYPPVTEPVCPHCGRCRHCGQPNPPYVVPYTSPYTVPYMPSSPQITYTSVNNPTF